LFTHPFNQHTTHWPSALEIDTIIDKDTYTADDAALLYKHILRPKAEAHTNIDNALGSILKYHSIQHILSTYDVVQLDIHTVQLERDRFKQIVSAYANKCTYERSGDTYIHLLLKGKLKSYKNALLSNNTPPYDAISQEYGDSANTLVRPYIETPPSAKILHVKWHDSMDLDGFHFVTGLLRELLDGLNCTIHINTHICHCSSPDIPYLFACTLDFDVGFGSSYGYIYKHKMHLPPKSDAPLTDFFLGYLAACSHARIQAVADMHTALYNPNALAASSPFNVLLE